jgi:hypothetical protein
MATKRRRSSAAAALAWWLLAAAPTVAGAPPRHVAPAASLGEVRCLRIADDKAVVRFGTGPIELVSIGDLVGANRAVVTEIGGGRLVLDERFVDTDGQPNRARVVVKAGETGGTRYALRTPVRPAGQVRLQAPPPKKDGSR